MRQDTPTAITPERRVSPLRQLSLTSLLPGLLTALIIASIAYFLTRFAANLATTPETVQAAADSPAFDPLALALLIGLLVNSIVRASARQGFSPRELSLRETSQPDRTNQAPRLVKERSRFQAGAALALRFILPAGAILYGTQLDLNALAPLGSGSQLIWIILLVILTMIAFYVFIFWLNALWHLPTKTSELIASGSAVCGPASIVVLSPTIEAEPEDTSVSLLSITAVGLFGLMIYPLLRSYLSLPDALYAVLSGATLQYTGLVQAAVAGMEPALVDYALAINSLRIIMLVVVSLLTALLHTRLRSGNAVRDAFKRNWFIVPFIVLALLVSFVPALKPLFVSLRPWTSFLLALAAGCIGLVVDINNVIRHGVRPLLVSLFGWIVVVIIFLFVSPIFL